MFRIKIALLTVLISGAVLVGFGLYSVSVMEKVGMDRIDREMLTLGEGHLAIRPPRDYWQNFEKSLRFIYGNDRLDNLVVLVKDQWNEVLFQSPHWPAEITEDSFPGFDRKMETRPPANPGPAGNGRGGRGGGEERRGPPPEAYRACEGKTAGSASRFVDHHGVIVTGRCEDDNGTLVLRPDNRRPPAEDQQSLPVPRIKKQPYFVTIQTLSGSWRTGIMGTDRLTLMAAVNLSEFYGDVSRYRWAFLGTVPAALLLLASGGWLIARRALRPVSLITRTAEGISSSALDKRVPLIEADREFTRLVDVINGMLDRLEASFGQAIRFSADAAHELQTPLAILLGELDYAVQHSPLGSEEQQRYSALLEEVQRLKSIVQKLLILARADAGRLELRLETMDISALIEEAAEDAGVMAPHLRIEKNIMPGIFVKADPDLLGQAIRNLTANAVKFNSSQGLVRFKLSEAANRAEFTISNTGTPIPPEDRERVFERFYRADKSRSAKVPGTGLGLSLAREIVRAHGGELFLDADSDNLVSFSLCLPRLFSRPEKSPRS